MCLRVLSGDEPNGNRFCVKPVSVLRSAGSSEGGGAKVYGRLRVVGTERGVLLSAAGTPGVRAGNRIRSVGFSESGGAKVYGRGRFVGMGDVPSATGAVGMRVDNLMC